MSQSDTASAGPETPTPCGSRGVPTLQIVGDAKRQGNVFLFVSNCPASGAALHVFGRDRYEPHIDLSFAGAPDCRLYVVPEILAPAVADLAGQYAFSFQMPAHPSLAGASFYTQGFPVDAAANRWGRSATQYGRLQVGQ